MTSTPISAGPAIDSIEDKLLALACSERLAKASILVKNYTLASAAIALVPLPLLDQIVLISLQLKMIHELAKIYDIPFQPNIASAIVSSLLSGVTGGLMAKALQSLAKSVPVLATLGSGSIAISSASVTFALGSVFIKHFEDNGTFININLEWMKSMFHQQLTSSEADGGTSFEAELGPDHLVASQA
ncbi:MAG: YcjF family protein [Cyanobium sp.]|jgi:uncharacterized protein (DUF697 family)